MVPGLVQAGYRVICLDFIGFGRSDKLIKAERLTPELHVSTLLALMRHLQLTQVNVVAHGWAGVWLLWGLRQIPKDCIGRLILMNTAFLPLPVPHELSITNLFTIWMGLCITATLGPYVPVPLHMYMMSQATSVPAALCYGMPFASAAHKTAVCWASQLAPFAYLSNHSLYSLRRLLPIRVIETIFPRI
eukprot:jgi/Chrzof1/5731/Cz16g13120.t1